MRISDWSSDVCSSELTSNMPAAWRTAWCSSSWEAYWIGMSQPAKSTSLAPRRTCSACRAVFLSVTTTPDSRVTTPSLARLRLLIEPRAAILGRHADRSCQQCSQSVTIPPSVPGPASSKSEYRLYLVGGPPRAGPQHGEQSDGDTRWTDGMD